MLKRKVTKQKPKKSKPVAEKKVMGRPRIEFNQIDWFFLDELCQLQCTGEECAALLEISYETLVRNIQDKYGLTFPEYFEQKSAAGKMSLRRKQWQVGVEEGDVKMLIHLGKNILNQSDKSVVDNKSSDGSMTPQVNQITRTIIDNRKKTKGK